MCILLEAEISVACFAPDCHSATLLARTIMNDDLFLLQECLAEHQVNCVWGPSELKSLHTTKLG